jgi:tRNA-splicing ligase RtcB
MSAKAKAAGAEKSRHFTDLNLQGVPYNVFGASQIEPRSNSNRWRSLPRLPIQVAGALMPDAHQGYGLPIGGVLATDNAIIPYAVGVDIGCRMCLSIFDLPASELRK